MILLSLLLIPMLGLLSISVCNQLSGKYLPKICLKQTKFIGLLTSILNLFICLIIFIKLDFSCNHYQFVQMYYNVSSYHFYLGIDGLSIYFILLTCIIIPISLLSNWNSVSKNEKSYVIILLLLEIFLLLVFMVLDVLLYYIFFESILFPLFILIGLYGSSNKIRASFYLFLYTLIGSLFLLLSIINMYTITGVTDFDTLFKTNFGYYIQFFIFYGIFLSFAVKTPTIFLNNWLLKAHVESPLGGSLILASVVLKLSLYGILRLILPILPKAYLDNTYLIYIIGVITIIYASFGTLRTIDIKELIAYSSVSHAAVYFLGVFSNNIQGIEGAIIFGLAHGFVSSGLFICAGGVLYDRSGNRLITVYRGMAQIMPIFSIFFFILCLANAGAPLTFNFLGEFMCLYGTFERLPLLGIFASTSVILSASYSMYMLNRIIFGGSLSKLLLVTISDLNKREFFMVFTLISFTVFFGIYPAPILDGLHYYSTSLIYNYDYSIYSMSLLPLFSLKRVKSSFIRVTLISAFISTVIGFSLKYAYTYYEMHIYVVMLLLPVITFIQDLKIYKLFYPVICEFINRIFGYNYITSNGTSTNKSKSFSTNSVSVLCVDDNSSIEQIAKENGDDPEKFLGYYEGRINKRCEDTKKSVDAYFKDIQEKKQSLSDDVKEQYNKIVQDDVKKKVDEFSNWFDNITEARNDILLRIDKGENLVYLSDMKNQAKKNEVKRHIYNNLKNCIKNNNENNINPGKSNVDDK